MTPAASAVALALSLYALAKVLAWAQPGARGGAAHAVRFGLLWHGMDPAATEHRAPSPPDLGWRAAAAAGRLVIGCALLALAVALPAHAPPALRGVIALAGFAFGLHFGALRLVELAWRRAGRNVPPLMRAPHRADTLRDFWSRRWNAAYAALTREIVYRPLRARLGAARAHAATFVVSGLVHELAITVPAGAGHGGPTLYFALQAAADAAQRKWGLTPFPGRALTWGAILAPMPLLFPAAFLDRVVVPVAEALVPAAVPRGVPADALLSLALLVAGLGHFVVLAAGVQVPHRLKWREELARLSPFNQRIVWAYHAFLGLTITGFGTLTLVLRDEMVRGDQAALLLAALIAAWWCLRLLIDAAWYRACDWPAGAGYEVGHGALLVAFVGMAGTYVGALATHWGASW